LIISVDRFEKQSEKGIMVNQISPFSPVWNTKQK